MLKKVPFPRTRSFLWQHRGGLLALLSIILVVGTLIASGVFDIVGYSIERTTGYAQNNNQINYAVGTIDYSLRIHYALNPAPPEGEKLYTFEEAVTEANRRAAEDQKVYRSGRGDPAPFPGIRALVITVRNKQFAVLGTVPFD